ncbi:hypothetical protein [Chryseobacterium gwangjuense]|uniref:hypothetical protein n=1 Tax=Chryseobacterium gwangjuense TaxID=1069980 RepID=UPI001E3CDE1F|nr:hypothetical protein [Chryseobacterium gwangjuense]MCE3075142.1 hypothetical protein [Chryseobacterium gwangjuense]
MKKEIMKHNWDFTLYEENEKKILNVAFYNSYFDFTREFKLEKDELNYDFEKLKELAEDIRNNYEKYKDREIND